MKLTLTLDSAMYFSAGIVGSSIHGELLKPNDIDIAICFKLPLLTYLGAITLRLGKYNFIICHGITLRQYIDEFDMDIIKGSYISLITGKHYFSYCTEQSLKNHKITQCVRDCRIFQRAYDPRVEKTRQLDRAKKYILKLPKDWSFIPLPFVKKQLERM